MKWKYFYKLSKLWSPNILFCFFNFDNLRLEICRLVALRAFSCWGLCAADDTTECKFARVEKKSQPFKLSSITQLLTNFHKSRIRTWTHVAQLPLPRALSEGPFNRKMCKCICIFFFFSLSLLCGFWPHKLKTVLKTVLHYTAQSVHLWCVFMQYGLHLHIFAMDRPDQCKWKSYLFSLLWKWVICIFFFLNTQRLSVYFCPTHPDLCLFSLLL